MRRMLFGSWMLLAWCGCTTIFGETGHFELKVTDIDGRPVTNAVVSVFTLNKLYFGVGGKDSDYNRTQEMTDSNGVARVTFNFIVPDFDWFLDSAPDHYTLGAKYDDSECFDTEMEESDYLDIDSSTADGQAKLAELQALEESGDLNGYASKFLPKSMTCTNNTIRRSLVLYPKRNPQPMYSCQATYGIGPIRPIGVETNGEAEVKTYPLVGYDLKVGDYLPPYNIGEYTRPSVADFFIEMHQIITNGVRTIWGAIVFPPGCGAYFPRMTGCKAFPSVYTADPDASYNDRLEFLMNYSVETGRPFSGRQPGSCVMRTRPTTNDNGVVSYRYSKIISMSVQDYLCDGLSFESSVYNDRIGDTNLEFDVKRNLFSEHGDIYGGTIP